MIFRSDQSPWGVAWAPDGDRVAIGGHFHRPRLCIVGTDGRVLDDADTRGRQVRVETWTREHGVIAWTWRDDPDRETLSAYRHGGWRELVRRWWPFARHWWPSPDGQTEVAFGRGAIHVRGRITARWTARDLGAAWADRGAAPDWWGSTAIIVGELVLDLRNGTLHPISDEVPAAHPIAVSPDGAVAVWRDTAWRTWWARVEGADRVATAAARTARDR